MSARKITGRCIGAAVLAGCLVQSALGAVANAPRVEGPIPVTATSHPFLGAAYQVEPTDLAKWGYVEEEYLVSGNASVYDYAADKSVKVIHAGASYVDRIIVRRPKDMRRFNGRALVEMLNASVGPDISFQWSGSHDFLMSNGYVYVGVTSKPYSAEKLRQFDPARYARISWANPAPKQGCEKPGPWAQFPGWSTNATEDGLLWDIVAQVGVLLKTKDAANPLHASPARRVFLSGHSQSGGYVGTFARDFQDVLRMPDGSPIYDGFMQTGSAGLSMINQCSPTPSYDDPHMTMRSAMPLIRVMTLTDFYNYTPEIKNYRTRVKPDSDAPGDLFRLYEVAGAEHSAAAFFKYGAAMPADMIRAGNKPLERKRCLGTDYNPFELGIVFDAALESLDRWRDGTPPPHADRIVMDRPGDPDSKATFDGHGNVQGGFRTPRLNVPVASYYGKSIVEGDAARSCFNRGYSVAFDDATLKTLYPTHADYVAKVKASVADLTAKRFLTRWDGQRIIAQAEQSTTP